MAMQNLLVEQAVAAEERFVLKGLELVEQIKKAIASGQVAMIQNTVQQLGIFFDSDLKKNIMAVSLASSNIYPQIKPERAREIMHLKNAIREQSALILQSVSIERDGRLFVLAMMDEPDFSALQREIDSIETSLTTWIGLIKKIQEKLKNIKSEI